MNKKLVVLRRFYDYNGGVPLKRSHTARVSHISARTIYGKYASRKVYLWAKRFFFLSFSFLSFFFSFFLSFFLEEMSVTLIKLVALYHKTYF